MKLFAGIDLHSNNSVIAIIDNDNKRIFKKKIKNDLQAVLDSLAPFKEQIHGIVVESTYNWYWLVDGLMDQGYRAHLANPSAIKQYEGLKHSDDTSDAFHLANLLRLGILPEGYIYPKEQRSVRDLLRRRMHLVQQRTAQILSFQNLVAKNLGRSMHVHEVNRLSDEDVEGLFEQQHVMLSGKACIATIRFLAGQIKAVEKAVHKAVRLSKQYQLLKTVPGIWETLAKTIMLETGPIERFSRVGNYASYCRCVKSSRLSNSKQKGAGNSKNGNRYLSWAYVEAANYALWNYDYVKKYYQRKQAKTNSVVAIKAIAHKLSRACYFIMRDQVAFDPQKAFS